MLSQITGNQPELLIVPQHVTLGTLPPSGVAMTRVKMRLRKNARRLPNHQLDPGQCGFPAWLRTAVPPAQPDPGSLAEPAMSQPLYSACRSNFAITHKLSLHHFKAMPSPEI